MLTNGDLTRLFALGLGYVRAPKYLEGNVLEEELKFQKIQLQKRFVWLQALLVKVTPRLDLFLEG